MVEEKNNKDVHAKLEVQKIPYSSLPQIKLRSRLKSSPMPHMEYVFDILHIYVKLRR
jgi:hypothetical protein